MCDTFKLCLCWCEGGGALTVNFAIDGINNLVGSAMMGAEFIFTFFISIS